MALTPFGKAVRKLRIDRDMLLKEMADSLGVTSAFLSAIEAGRKPIPAGFAGRIADALHLDMADREQLQRTAEVSAREFRIPIRSNATDLDRSVAAMLARRFPDLDEEQVREIRAILDRRRA